jgi:hypothetical protein
LRLPVERPAGRAHGDARRLSRAARGASQHGRRAAPCGCVRTRPFVGANAVLERVNSAGRHSQSRSVFAGGFTNRASRKSCGRPAAQLVRLGAFGAFRPDHSVRRLGGLWGAPRSDRQGSGRARCARAAGQEGLTARRRRRDRHGRQPDICWPAWRIVNRMTPAPTGRGVGVPRSPVGRKRRPRTKHERCAKGRATRTGVKRECSASQSAARRLDHADQALKGSRADV